MINIEKIGRHIINVSRNIIDPYRLFLHAIKNISALRIASVRSVLYKQIYFTGVEAFPKIAVIGSLFGVVIITQVSNIVGLNALLTGKILVWMVVREVGPLFASIIVIIRSCTAISSELGSMKVNREIESLTIMGIPSIKYLIIPRIFGLTLSLFMLNFYFQIMSIFGGLIITFVLIDIPLYQQIDSIFSTLSIFEMFVSLLKSILFGIAISTISCYHGYNVKSSITEIPQATLAAVTQSLFSICIIDGIIAIVLFL